MFENYAYWAISSQAPNRGRFNDYPVREYNASDWHWKCGTPKLLGEDIVYAYRKL